MKFYIIIFSLFLSLQVVGQTTSDLVAALELIFDRQEFEPAFNSDFTTNGNVIIQSIESGSRQPSVDTFNQTIRRLRQEDFYALKHRVKVIREEEFEFSGIPEHAILWISGNGNDQEIKLRLHTTITDERKQYQWSYVLVKESGEWKILKHALAKSSGVLSPR